ncbi:alpha/beta hydrolase [Methylobacterium sp. WSM2598]|uniref:alpha/beta fold hydrolase n=1 Tax=Methylobacterium sp. WSM2598 TaxID=398261 RepID=UPI00037331FA
MDFNSAPVRRASRGSEQTASFRYGDVRSISRQHFHRIAYVEWGDPACERVIVCVHGLSRQGRDFDDLARALAAKGYRVVCPDLVGRGRSGRLRDPEDYALPQYAVDMTVLLAHVGAPEVYWVGTSLGGLIGMILAGMPESPISRLVINDIGPFLPWAALRRLGDTIRDATRLFDTIDRAEAYFRGVLAPFGALTDAQWRHLTEHSLLPRSGGGYELHYDPGIGHAFRPGRVYNVSLWNYWDAMRCPALVLRGETSDLLLARTATEMVQRRPGTECVEIPGCGHAPALLDPDQIRLVVEWLTR